MRERGQHSPLVGFNSNVRYRGHTFHIQTEDSGRSRPHVTTLLFADGGHIIASRRTEYAAVLEDPDLEQIVKRRMQDQHRGVLRELMSGALDEKVTALLGPLSPRTRPASHPKPGDGPSSSVREPPSSDLGCDAASERAIPVLKPSLQNRDSARSPLGLGSFVDPLVAVTPGGRAEPEPPSSAEQRSDLTYVPRGPNAAGHVPHLRAAAVQPVTPEPTATRPAVVFEASQSSLFGLGELNEESLNDVILSFISQELDSGD